MNIVIVIYIHMCIYVMYICICIMYNVYMYICIYIYIYLDMEPLGPSPGALRPAAPELLPGASAGGGPRGDGAPGGN